MLLLAIQVRHLLDYKNFYNEELINLVNKKCEKELSIFNYDFNGPKDDKSLLTF